jgi:hypothetical protein
MEATQPQKKITNPVSHKRIRILSAERVAPTPDVTLVLHKRKLAEVDSFSINLVHKLLDLLEESEPAPVRLVPKPKDLLDDIEERMAKHHKVRMDAFKDWVYEDE